MREDHDVNPFSSPPVFEKDQVITAGDLIGFVIQLSLLKRQTRWWQWKQAIVIKAVLMFVEELLRWVANRKGGQK